MVEIRTRRSNTVEPGAPPDPARRRILVAGAAMAAGGALAPLRSSLAWEGGAPRVDHVLPLRGAEGDSIIVTGRGFDPEPGNNCIVLGDGLARVAVVEAAPNHLVGVIGPVARAWSGPVGVTLGRGRALPDHVVTHGGVTSVATNVRCFEPVASVAAPATFELVRRSPFTVEGSLADGLEIGFGSSSNVCYRSARVDFWLPTGAHAHFELGLDGGGSLSPAAYAHHLASHINDLGLGEGFSASAAGATLRVVHAGAGRGFGMVRSC